MFRNVLGYVKVTQNSKCYLYLIMIMAIISIVTAAHNKLLQSKWKSVNYFFNWLKERPQSTRNTIFSSHFSDSKELS